MELDHQNRFKDQKSPAMLENGGATTDSRNQWKQIGEDERKMAVQEEMKRVHQLPSNSSYAIHRLRVLNKIFQLMSIQRSASEDEELELLFSGLSI